MLINFCECRIEPLACRLVFRYGLREPKMEIVNVFPTADEQ